MCIRTRITHWRATGVIQVLSATLIAASLVNRIGPETSADDGALLKAGAFLLVGLSLVYAMYLSPQARGVRQQIVRARRVEP